MTFGKMLIPLIFRSMVVEEKGLKESITFVALDLVSEDGITFVDTKRWRRSCKIKSKKEK